MFSAFRTKFGIPGVIAVIALVFAMFGGAYAASNSGGKSDATASATKKGPRGPRGPRGKTGPTGPVGPAGAQGQAGAAGAKGDKGDAGAQGAAGATGPAGAAGKNVQVGTEPEGGSECLGLGGVTVQVEGAPATKKVVCNGEPGEEGAEGPEGSPWTVGGKLPSGKTLTGTWGIFQPGEGFKTTEISFPLPVVPAPTPVFVPSQGSGEEKKAQKEQGEKEGCPGLKEGVPTANPGKLCVYASNSSGFEGFVFLSPLEGGFEFEVAGKAGALFAFGCGAGCNAPEPRGGLWAVTAQ